jgi:hypothetical protein
MGTILPLSAGEALLFEAGRQAASVKAAPKKSANAAVRIATAARHNHK